MKVLITARTHSLSLALSPQVGRLATDFLAALPETTQLLTRPAKLLELIELQALSDGGLLDLNTGLAFARSLVRPTHAACAILTSSECHSSAYEIRSAMMTSTDCSPHQIRYDDLH